MFQVQRRLLRTGPVLPVLPERPSLSARISAAEASARIPADITVTVYADCYSLYTTATPGALNIAVDGQYVSLASPAIERDGTAGAGSVEINSRTFTVPLLSGAHREIPLDVAWLYRGSYSGVNLDTIECGGNISLNR